MILIADFNGGIISKTNTEGCPLAYSIAIRVGRAMPDDNDIFEIL